MFNTKDAFLTYLNATNIAGSGKASSYVRALDLLSEMLALSPFSFGDCIDIWHVHALNRIDELRMLVAAQQKKGIDSPWVSHGIPKSYLLSGFCQAALTSYRQFLVEQAFESSLVGLYERGTEDGQVVSLRLQEQIALYDVGEGEDVVRQTKVRLNQNVFRKMILGIYDNACCITGLNIPEINRASHIVPWAEDAKKRLDPSNGLCLSATYDAAFDRNLISLDDDYRLIVSKEISDHYTNQSVSEYFLSKEGQVISLPSRFLPDKRCLEKHRDRGDF
ncbi:Uncharacterised protein [BD1-7 clade bacterium]|nr:Uncharacterised protein [BD1-7 clade bacterium]